jgi:hypothetical protein
MNRIVDILGIVRVVCPKCQTPTPSKAAALDQRKKTVSLPG